MRNIKKGLLLVGLLAIGWVVWWCGMNYTGYCHAEGRYLSDDEKIRPAIQFVLDRYPPTISKTIERNVNGVIQKSDFWYAPEQPVKYRDIAEFMAINPDCCELSMRTGEGRGGALLDRVTGYFSTYVIVWFKVRYLDENNIENYGKKGMAVAIKNCGESWSGL